MGKLTAKFIEKQKQPGRYADGLGLYLMVRPEGSKSWLLRVQASGKRRDYGLGGVSILSLAEAREKARQGRKWAKEGLDPSQEWRKAFNTIPTFEEAARACFATKKVGWENGKHVDQWIKTLEDYAFPTIGRTRVDHIDVPMIQNVLAPIWREKEETARRVRQRIGAVLSFAHSKTWRANDAPNPRTIAEGLAKQSGNTDHHPALPYDQLSEYIDKLRTMAETTGRLAVEFTILCAARSGETRGAVWSEIDLDAAEWRLPRERMLKGKRPHTVPLSDRAVQILRRMAEGSECKPDQIIFPGMKGKKLSDATLAKAFRSVGAEAEPYTVHGTARSSFRDWAAEQQTQVPGDVVEAALAHAVKSKTEAAYRRTQYLELRRPLMQSWADYLGRGPKVVTSRRRERA